MNVIMKFKQHKNTCVRAIAGVVAMSALALGGFAVGDLGTQIAMASDNKVISGHACAPQGNDILTDRSNPRYLRAVFLGQSYMCPVVRDDTTGKLDFARVRVENLDSTSSRPVCTVHSVSVDGGAIDSELVSASNSPGFQTLKFDLNGFTEYDHGHYVIECFLGKNDRIISYRYEED